MNEIFTAKLKLASGLKLALYSFDGREALSSLYTYSVVALGATGLVVDFEQLLGAPVEVLVTDSAGQSRSYHGLLASAAYEGVVADHMAYRLEVVPTLWMATRSANVRVFQKKTVNDIIKSVVDAYGINIKFEVQGSQRVREYCVQYRESDFNFISRLMEEEGIFYFFRHTPGQHLMVLADLPAVHVNELGLGELSFQVNDRGRTQGAVITQWRWSREIRTGKVSLRDHNFMVPAETYAKDKVAAHTHPHGKVEAYDYPSGVPVPSDEASGQSVLDGETVALASRRLEGLQAQRAAANGSTNSLRLCTGARFKLAAHPVAGQDGEYIVHSTHIRIRIAGYESGAAETSTHECDFSAFPSGLPFRPPCVTPKPRVQGPQTAVVVGPAGEEIFTDKFGRVKVQFFWDREGKKDAQSSCFVRVAQPSAGKQWGVVMLPRIGQEVVVDFLEGDPDRPLIVGGVYNAENMPPLALPEHQTVSTIRTKSTKQGAQDAFNELRFEDKKGSEYVYLQAQKDLIEFVRNDTRIQIGANLHHMVRKDRKEKVDGEYLLSVGKDFKYKVSGKYNLKVIGALKLDTDDVFSLKSKADMTSESTKSISFKAGTDLHVKAGTNAGLDAGTNVHIKGGTNVVIEAGTQLTIKAGASSIVLGPDGVSITGAMVKMNSGGGAGSGSGASPVATQKPDEPADPDAAQDPV